MSKLKPAQKRRRFGWRRIHKWIGVAGGTFLLIWIISGIVIAIPGLGGTRLSQRSPATDFSAVSVSPAQAIASLNGRGVTSQSVQGVSLNRWGSRTVYSIQARGEGTVHVDAVTGETVTINADEARRVAREMYEGPGTPSEPELLERHDPRYFNGELPVYRVSFDDPHGTQVTIAVRSGTVSWRDGRSRFRYYMSAFHDLWPVRPALGRNAYVLGMVGGGLLALITALTGYWLAFRRGGWRWKRWGRK